MLGISLGLGLAVNTEAASPEIPDTWEEMTETWETYTLAWEEYG
jgi:hypothetical protein